MFQVAQISSLKVGASYIIRLLLACVDATGLRLNFHNGAMIGFFSISWCGHLVHVAIAASRGYAYDLYSILNLHQSLEAFYSAKWVLFSKQLLTFLGGLNPETS